MIGSLAAVGAVAGGAFMYMKKQAAASASGSGDEYESLNQGENEGGDNDNSHKLLLEDDRISLLGGSTTYTRSRK